LTSTSDENRDNLKEFRVVVTVEPNLKIEVKSKDPCAVLGLSYQIVKKLRVLNLEPKAQVMP
jgi:hypothetical protein